MKISRHSRICVLLFVVLRTCSGSFQDPPHRIRPRSFSLFSRPAQDHPDKENTPKGEPPVSGGIITHLGNVLHGGSIGIEFRPLGHLSGLVGHAKKILPGHDVVGQPNHQDEPNNPDDHWEEVEEPVWDEKPEPPKPVKPKPERPRWEDIGEEDLGEDGTGLLQPRTRVRRFIESKIYHVPLLYRSNARPFKVVISSRNDLQPKEAAKT